jgi:hypothetical protein
MSSRRASISSTGGKDGKEKDVSGNPAPAQKKFLNGWTPEQERLMGKWADVAGCYRWLHDRSEKKYTKANMYITIPVIILSTLTGTANFALDSFIEKDNYAAKSYAQATIGGISIFAGILTTLGNFLRFAQGSEAHRVSSVAWGKFQRQITVEISIHPNDRMDCMDFLHICRQDLDRLIEQSPPVPDDIIEMFEKEFKDVPNLNRPDICHGLEHTVAFNSTKPRLMKMVADATIYLKQKKKLLRDDILPDVAERISLSVKSEVEAALQKKWDDYEKKHPVEAPPVEEADKAAPFNFSGNWRRLIGINQPAQESVATGAQSPVQSLNEISMNELVTAAPKDIIITMKVNQEEPAKSAEPLLKEQEGVTEEPPKQLPSAVISHTANFD